MTAADRFWAKVDMSAGLFGCWPWMAARTRGDYGHLSIDDRMVRAHRRAWELTNGPIPSGLLALHRCDNPPCCNPAHLFLGTTRDNSDDKVAKGRAGMRLSLALVEAIRARRVTGASLRVVGREFGVNHATVSRVARGLTWRADFGIDRADRKAALA